MIPTGDIENERWNRIARHLRLKDNPIQSAWPAPELPRGSQDVQETLWSCQPSHPWGSKPPPVLPPLHGQPVVETAAALPGCFIYLFCTNRVAADSFSPGLKRERGKKKKEKCFLALLSTSVLAAGSRSSNSSSGPAGRRGVRYTGRCGPRGSLNGTGPQPWTDVVPNLMPPSGFSGKCPHLLS